MKWQSTKQLFNRGCTYMSQRQVEGTFTSRDLTPIAFARQAVARLWVRLAFGETNSMWLITHSVISYLVREHSLFTAQQGAFAHQRKFLTMDLGASF